MDQQIGFFNQFIHYRCCLTKVRLFQWLPSPSCPRRGRGLGRVKAACSDSVVAPLHVVSSGIINVRTSTLLEVASVWHWVWMELFLLGPWDQLLRTMCTGIGGVFGAVLSVMALGMGMVSMLLVVCHGSHLFWW